MKSLVRILMLRPTTAFAGAPSLVEPARGDPRAFHIALLLAIVALLNGVDLFCTLFAHRMGLLDEMNPLAESFLAHGLEPSLISYKILMVLAGSMMLWRLRRSTWAVPACWVLITAYSLLAVTWCFWAKDICQIFEGNMLLTR